MKKAVLAIVFLCAALSAQSPLGLWYPLGIPDLTVTGAASAMGGSGTAVADEYMGMGLNPANAAIGERAAFSALVSFDLTHISDNGASSTVSGYAPKLLSLIIPIGGAGNIGVSMQKRYEAGLNFYTTDALQDDAQGYKSITRELQRKGGLTAWQAGWAYRFGNGVGLGLIYERLYFNRDTRNVYESTFKYDLESGPATYMASVSEIEIVKFSSDGIRFGMQIPVHEKVTLGAAAEYILPAKGKDNGQTTRDIRRSDGLAASTEPQVRENALQVDLPPSINIGASYAPDERWLLALDANSTLWMRYKCAAPEYGMDEDFCPSAKETFGISAGVRFIPAANILSSSYWEKVYYSAGLRYTTLPHNHNAGAREYALSIGAGLPIPNEGGMIDIVIAAGRRSDDRYSGYGENIVKLQLGINGGRSWFQKDASRDY